jgi:hemerythrin
MASIEWDYKVNPSVEIIKIQRSKIRECENTIHHEIADTQQSCAHINDLLCQLKLLYEMHFMYEEQLLEEVNVASAEGQKHVHDLFLKSIDQLRTENDQCHTFSFNNNIIQLRLDFISIMNNETMMLCDFIKNIYV